MEKYKAKSNGINNQELQDVPEKSAKQQKQESTEKVVDLAGEVALDYFTAGKGSAIKNAASNVPVVGNAVNKVWDGAVKNVSKGVAKTQVGDVAKKLDDAGITDAAKSAKGLINVAGGSAAGGAGGAAGNAGAAGAAGGAGGSGANLFGGGSNIGNSGSNAKVASGKSSNPFSFGSSSPLTGNIMPSFGVNKKTIIIFSAVFFITIVLITSVVSGKDHENLDITNNPSLGSSMSASSSGGTKECTNEEIESRLIYVGDSRIVGLKSAIAKDNISYITEMEAGSSWLKNTAMGLLETELSNKTNPIVVFALGVNGLDIDNYINIYNSIIEKHPDVSFYFMSVNPVDDALVSSNYGVTTAGVVDFNRNLQSAFSDKYLDTYSSLSDFATTDGLHYDSGTSIKIHDLLLSNLKTKISCGTSGGTVNSESLLAKLEDLGNWYIENVAIYSQKKYFQTPYKKSESRADCTGFAVAYMSYVSGADLEDSYSGEMVYHDGSWAKHVAEHGWKSYTTDEIGTLMPGDVLVSNPVISYSRGNHAEIYIDESHTFGWGSAKKKYPTDSALQKLTKSGHTIYRDKNHDYVTVYRYELAIPDQETSTPNSNSTNNTNSNQNKDVNIKNMIDSSFNHGNKPKSNQKYIMLHDTEMSVEAEAVVSSWKNAGTGTAAHFVVGRDGTIIQAVNLDNIAHHAGWGGPGDFDSKFGVGNNDGKGNGDDLKGQKTTGWESYTSYGMNSYSIGIEMCHVNGEDYPEAQLKAVDQVIAYIDSYFGTKSTIIDHKDWRPSNSDTDANFATYLSNYKTLRHH